jgi:hypothetical protein
MINEFLSVFDFVVYQPIVSANRKNFDKTKDYVLEVFKISSSNCSILGHSIRTENKSTQRQTPGLSRSSMGLIQAFGDGDEDNDEDDEDKEEDDEPKEIVEERPKIVTNPTKRRGRPRKRNV